MRNLKITSLVVIRTQELGESDKLITGYSKESGKIQLLAKGAKRSLKRFVNKLELFSYLTVQYNDKYRLPIINWAELLDSFLPLRQRYNSYTAAILICEHLYYWTAANDGDEELFSCLLWFLRELAGQPLLRSQFLVLFLSKFYDRLGYRPDLTACAVCGKLDNSAAPFAFRAGQGTIICRRCSTERGAIPLALPTIKLLGRAFELPVEKLSRLKLNTQACREALNLFRCYGRYLLDRDIQAWQTLNSAGYPSASEALPYFNSKRSINHT
jgi:DNA repair protein RecO (recombination protein O)